MSELSNQKLAVRIEDAMDRGYFGVSSGNPYILAGQAVHALREPRALEEGALVLLRAVLEGLECENIDSLIRQPPETLRAVGSEIAKAAKLGSPLYQSSR